MGGGGVVVVVWELRVLVVSAAVQVSKLAEARPPVTEIVVVLVSTARGRVQGAEGASGGAAAFVVEHQQGIVGGRGRVIVCCL